MPAAVLPAGETEQREKQRRHHALLDERLGKRAGDRRQRDDAHPDEEEVGDSDGCTAERRHSGRSHALSVRLSAGGHARPLMALLPAGFALPPLPYLLALLLAGAAVAYGLRERRPPIDDRFVRALAPWMLVGAWLHVLHVVGAAPALLDPLLGTPAAYISTAVLAGAVWLAADASGRETPRLLFVAGLAVCLAVLAVGVRWATEFGSLTPAWPAVAALLGIGLGVGLWTALTRFRPDVAITGSAGALTVIAHSLDGVSTAVGIDILGAAERTPLSRAIIEFGAMLPTAEFVGSAWLFIVVKAALACGVTLLLADYVREDPEEGRLLFVLVAAVGLGPGAHNLLLFTIS